MNWVAMPTTTEILAQLQLLATESLAVAIAWHVATAAVIAALVVGWRPGPGTIAALLAAPLLSASLLAGVHGNAFNAATLALTAAGVLLLAPRKEDRASGPPLRWGLPVAIGLAALAWAYPHFLDDQSAAVYLIAAPLGVIPCPSLALAVAGWLSAYPRVSRGQGAVLAIAAAFYGAFGALRLGIWIDLALVAGAVAIALEIRTHTREAPLIARGGLS